MQNKPTDQKQAENATTRASSNENRLSTPVPASSFYATDSRTPQTPPTLPKRRSTAGTSHATYYPPPSSPPYREPEPINDADHLIPPHVGAVAPSAVVPPSYDYNLGWANAQDDWIAHPVDSFGTGGIDDELGSASGPPIDGRSAPEEKSWWDSSEGFPSRPGPGMLPSQLVEELHNSDHSLFAVSVKPVNISPHGSSSSARSTSPLPFVPPTTQELNEAVPHPHAYFCRKHHGWVLLLWKSSSILPPLAKSFKESQHQPFPSQDRRRRTTDCLGEHPFGLLPNRTHHFHVYNKAVDAQHLTPAFIRKPWEREALTKESRRRVTISSDDRGRDSVLFAGRGDVTIQVSPEMVSETIAQDADLDLLDLYVCCQCSFYVVASDVIPGVVPRKYVEEFTLERSRNPTVGKSGEQTVITGWETILSIIENKLWKGNNKSLSVSGKTFRLKVGWNTTVQKLMESMGFALSPSSGPGDHLLTPPNTDPGTEQGLLNRQKLLRSWVEISAFLADYERRFPTSLKDYTPHTLHVRLSTAREIVQQNVGAHPEQMPRGLLPDDLHHSDAFNSHWKTLGLTKWTYDSDVLQFAYLAQCRCDPQNTMEYFTSLELIVSALREFGKCPQELEEMLVSERSRGRFTAQDVRNAASTLGFGRDNDLKVDFEEDVPDEFIARAWRDAIRRSWMDPDGAARRRDLNDAFRMIAESRGSREMVQQCEEEKTSGMTPEKAYATLEVPQGVEEEMLITIYNMRVEDQPAQLEKMRDALKCIAEFTCSDRLKKFFETGSDPGVVMAPTRPDWPRGLNQLGNTCYLNSLLQYFYTIKDLREAVAPLAAITEKYADDERLKEDDLKNHRVGGRMVTRREVVRSRKFVSQLANLFHHLEHSDVPAVTPTIELAKLALVTSKDEEEDDGERGGTESSHSTDATLVDESTQPATMDSPTSGSPLSPLPAVTSSVLGKRPRGICRKRTDNLVAEPEAMEEGEKEKEDYVLVSKPPSPAQSAPGLSRAASVEAPPLSTTSSMISEGGTGQDGDGDVEMVEGAEGSQAMGSTSAKATKAPPLPPRPKTQATTSGSDMMFGKQHDVAECMDNCMFQIETALLRFGELAGSDVNKQSVVKRLFYGKIRQRLSTHSTDASGSSKASLHEREDYFSHLPVNVSEESFDLYDGLSGYFDDMVEYEGKKAQMEVSLVELPPILQIQLQRVQFNKETLQPYKSHAYVKFGETICMDRFLDDAPSEKKAKSKAIQAELNTIRDRIYALTQTKHAPYAESLGNSVVFLYKQQAELNLSEVDDALLQRLRNEKDAVTQEIEQCRSRATTLKEQLEQIWRDEARAEYELTSVFVHRGATPSFGHYFIFQRWLPEYPEQWFKYNDSDVTVVPKEEVLADTTGSIANPYLLVFARKGSQVIDTVQRFDSVSTVEAD